MPRSNFDLRDLKEQFPERVFVVAAESPEPVRA
jgi:hypothetical protein